MCHKILQHGADSFTTPLKEGMLRVIITVKNSLLSARFEPMNLGSSGTHDNHYATKNYMDFLTSPAAILSFS
jgi:hypothetical protein